MKPMEAAAKHDHTNQILLDASPVKPIPECGRDTKSDGLVLWERYKKFTPIHMEREETLQVASGVTISYRRRSGGSSRFDASQDRQGVNNQRTVDRFGLPAITHEFYDDGITGTTTERPGYIRMKELGVSNPGANIVVENIDRAVRSGAVGFDFGSFIINNDLKLYDSDGPVSNERLLSEIGKATGVHFLISERNHRTRVTMMETGVYVPMPVLGYDKPSPGKLIPNKQQWVVRKVFEMRMNHAEIGEIKRWLEGNKIPTSRGELRWNPPVIRRMLCNFVYVGITQTSNKKENRSVAVETPHTRIVDPEVFEAVQLFNESRSFVRSPSTSGNRSLLGSKVRCPVCEARADRANRGRWMMCSRVIAGECTDELFVVAADIERNALACLRSLFDDGTHDGRFLRQLSMDETRQAKEARLVRDDIDRQIAEERDRIRAAREEAYRVKIFTLFDVEIGKSEALIADLSAKRARLAASGFVEPVSERLKGLAPALDFLIANVPLKRDDEGMEKSIAAVQSVIDKVTYRHTSNGMLALAVSFDFNDAGVDTPSPELAFTVEREYLHVPDAVTEHRPTIAWLRDSGRYDLTDDEFRQIMSLPSIRNTLGRMADDEVRPCFEALALAVSTNVTQKGALSEWQASHRVRNTWREFRAKEDSQELRDCFARLRPDAPNLDTLVFTTSPRPIRHLEKLIAIGHPIAKHPVFQEDGPDSFEDEEWKAVAAAVRHHPLLQRRGYIDRTRKLLEAHARTARAGLDWNIVHPGKPGHNLRQNLRRLRRLGLLDDFFREIVVAAGMWAEGDDPLPAIPKNYDLRERATPVKKTRRTPD